MMEKEYARINAMMHQKGVFTDSITGKEYYTGYEYATLYDWDQYFETIIQLYLGWDTVYARNGVKIFLDIQKENGHIQRSSKGCEEQLSEHVKPFLAQISLLIYNRSGNIDFLSDSYYNKMKKYLLYRLENPKNRHGLAYWDSAPHSGMDNQHERAGWWYDCFCCGVDLNSYLVRECRAFSVIADQLGHGGDAVLFRNHADRLVCTMRELMWDAQYGIFYDLDRRTGEKIRVRHIGIFASLWAEIADEAMAESMIRRYLTNADEFSRGFRYPALSAAMSGYTEEFLPGDLGCCWRANTWIPTNYIVFQGLRKYGYTDLAASLAQETYENVKRIGDREYYTTETAVGQGLDPFWGWSLLAHFMPHEADTGFDPTAITAAMNDHVLYNTIKEA